MKFNFWQILGVILLILGVVGVMYKRIGPETPPPLPATTEPVATMPTSKPTTQPIVLPVVP
jgi:hypothetical protein